MSQTDQPTYAPNPGYPPPAPVKGSNGLATAGFVLGLLGLLGSWIPFLNILGIIPGLGELADYVRSLMDELPSRR